MAGDSAFRRLLLDTVATTITQPPSSSSLIELLRIATPNLLASSSDAKQRQTAESKVRDKSRREKLFRTLQLKIHPDKHGGDGERATALFQEVTTFYGRCVDAMEREDERRKRWPGNAPGMNPDGGNRKADVATKRDHANNGSQQQQQQQQQQPGNDGGAKARENSANDETRRDDDIYGRFPQWYPWWYRHRMSQHDNNTNTNNPRQPRSSSGAAHSDYENAGADYDQEEQRGGPPQRQYPGRRRQRNNNSNNSRNRNQQQRRQPPGHQAFVATSTLLFPPLGIFAVYHTYKARKAWDDGRFQDAREHSDKAYSYAWYGCLIFVCLFIYTWLAIGDRNLDWWDWDEIKKKLSWDDGP